MTKEVLRLADALDLYATGDAHQRDIMQAAAELRRLHEVNQELLEALETIIDLYEYDSSCGELASRLYDARNISIFAIAKAEGEQA
jgi:hypothetical protein